MTAETRPNDKDKVRDHYDRMSPYYHSLWGEHIHHGYWIRGDESKETAQLQLIEHLAQVAGIQPGSRILDVGWIPATCARCSISCSCAVSLDSSPRIQ